MTHDEHNRVIARSVTMSIVGITLAIGLYYVRDVLITLYISGLLAVGLSPAVRWLERTRWVDGRRRRIPRWIALLLLYFVFLVFVTIIVALVVPPLIGQIQQLITELPKFADNAQRMLAERGLVKNTWSWSDLFIDTQASGMALTSIFGVVGSVLGALGQLITVLFLPFYLLLESSSLHGWLLRLVKPENQPRVDRILRSVTVKVGSWLGGQMLLCVIIGASATIGFGLMGVPFFYVLGLIAAIGELIPVIGPILAAVPAILLALTVSPQLAFWVLVYSWVQQLIENNVLVPRIMESQVGVSPVTIVAALLIGSTLLGFVGAILAVPTAAIIQVIIREHFEHERRAEE
jgi:predicted PurR-regulated permease PerM